MERQGRGSMKRIPLFFLLVLEEICDCEWFYCTLVTAWWLFIGDRVVHIAGALLGKMLSNWSAWLDKTSHIVMLDCWPPWCFLFTPISFEKLQLLEGHLNNGYGVNISPAWPTWQSRTWGTPCIDTSGPGCELASAGTGQTVSCTVSGKSCTGGTWCLKRKRGQLKVQSPHEHISDW